jgi:hypothetical protein
MVNLLIGEKLLVVDLPFRDILQTVVPTMSSTIEQKYA